MENFMRPFASAVVIALVATLAACDGGGGASAPAAGGGDAKAEDAGETLATVNGITVGSKEFEQAAQRKVPANGESLTLDEKKEVLNEIVAEKLLYGEALKKGLDKDPKVQKVMVNTLLREDVYSAVRNSDFSDEMLQGYYESHKDEFIVPEKVQVKRILIKVTDERPDAEAKKLAESLRAEVNKNPDSFKDVAAKNSEDPYKRRGGDVGFVSKEGKPGLDQAVVEKAFTLETNAISDVFKTDDGYNIVQVASRREKVERTFQQMKGSVLRKVKNDKMKELYDGYVGKVKTGANVTIDEAKLGAVEVKSSRRPFQPANAMGLPGADMGEEGEADAGLPEGLPGAEPAAVPPVPKPPVAGK
jgi:parvulin-like peptidyl-prolyl isomerase